MNAADVSDAEFGSRKWLILALVCVGTFMATLDASIVNVALPTLTSFFNTVVTTSQWFVIAYTFTITVLLLVFGKIGDLMGRRRLYVAGIAVFTAGSVLCGCSLSALMLILSRAFQAIGSAITMSAGPALLTEGFPSRERGKALGMMGTAVATGLLAGPIVGGAIVQYVNWRWMFFINVPIGIVLATLAARRLTGLDARHDGRLDLVGSALMAVGLAALVLGLTYGNDLGWSSAPIVALFVTAAGFGALFIWAEKRVKSPVLDLSLFANRAFSIGAVAAWSNHAANVAIPVFLPFYLESILHYQPGHVGLVLAAGPMTMAVVAPISGHLSDRIGPRFLASTGLLIAGLGILWLHTLGADATDLDVVLRLVIVGFGSAMFNSPNSSSVMGSVTRENLGTAGGVIALMRNLGMVSGVSLAGAIVTSRSGHFSIEGLHGAFLAAGTISLFGAAISALRSSRS